MDRVAVSDGRMDNTADGTDNTQPLHELMSPALHAAPDTPLCAVLADMTASHATAVVLVHEGRPTGLFSERDAVRLCLEADLAELLLGQVCSEPPLTASSDTDFIEAYRRMLAADARHLLIVDDEGLLLGLVEESDLVGRFGIEHFAHLDSVSRLMSTAVITLEPDATMRRAAQVLKRHSIGSVVVERDGEPIGIVTLTDLIRVLAANGDLENTPVAEIMSGHLITVDADESVFAAAHQMRQARVRHLVVTRGGRTAGVITEHDVVQTLEDRYSEVLRRIIRQQAREIDAQRRQLRDRDLLDQLLSRSHGLGLMLVTGEGRVAFMNGAARKLLEAEDVDEPDFEATLGQLGPANRRTLLALAAEPPTEEFTLRLSEPDRELGIRTITISQAGDGAGVSGMLLVINDELLAERTEEVLEFNQQVVREMPHMVIWVDQDGKVAHANTAVHTTLGHSPGALLGTPVRALFFDCPQARILEALERMRENDSEVFRSALRARDGRHIPVEIFGSHLEFRGRNYYGGFIRDLTDQQVVERALEDSQQRLLALVQASPDLIVVKDAENHWQVANRAGLEMFQLAHCDYQGRSDADLSRDCPPDYAEALLRNARTCEQAWAQRAPLRAISTLPHADGGTRYLDSIKVPIFDEAGQRKALVVIGRDVTERIRAEQQRDASVERLRAAVAAMDDLLLVLDAEHCFVDHYPRDSEALRLHQTGQLIGHAVETALPEHVVSLYDQAVERLRASGRPQGFEYALPGAQDGVRWFSARLTAQGSRGSESAGFTLLIRDISESREAEARVLQLNESLEERVALRTSEMQSALSELESFSYSISHDLRTPLRAIEGFGRLLETDYADNFDETGRDYLARIRLAAQRMASLIDDLLDLARLSRKSLHKEAVDLSALATDVAEELREQQPWRAVEVSVAPDLQVRADPVLLRVVLHNLIGNAWKFTDGAQDARIEVGYDQQRGQRRYYVRDNGAGFDMAYVDRLFKPFQRLHTLSEFDGTGIGLATIHRIVTRHGGSVSAEGKPGAGACFRFTLGD